MDNLEYKHPIGEGYFCLVSLYQCKTTDKLFARKQLRKKLYPDKDCRYRLEREIKLLHQLKDCDYIMPLVDWGEDVDKQKLWYLMPYAEQNLFDFIRAHNDSIPKEIRYEIAEQIIKAISYAHDKNILHRDISPTNVMVFGEGKDIKIKVCDFGLGKDKNSLSHYTRSSSASYGQILYVSPEQRHKLKSATHKSDIYALGKLLYFIFTGRDPQNFKQFELSTLVSKATEENPDDRFIDIEEFYTHFKELRKINLNPIIPDEFHTLKDVLKENNGEGLNWLKIHPLLIKGTYVDHVYADYLSPVTDIFSNVGNLKQYYSAVGNDIREFIRTFSNRINDCIGTLGWPFGATETFASLLIKMTVNIPDDETKLICLKQLWRLAYVSDQWKVQRSIKQVLNDTYINANIEGQLSEYIIESEVDVDMAQFAMLNLPKKIKSAIIQAKQSAVQLKEARKVQEASLDDIF